MCVRDGFALLRRYFAKLFIGVMFPMLLCVAQQTSSAQGEEADSLLLLEQRLPVR
jgi:hypothetical protein